MSGPENIPATARNIDIQGSRDACIVSEVCWRVASRIRPKRSKLYSVGGVWIHGLGGGELSNKVHANDRGVGHKRCREESEGGSTKNSFFYNVGGVKRFKLLF